MSIEYGVYYTIKRKVLLASLMKSLVKREYFIIKPKNMYAIMITVVTTIFR